MSKRIQILSAAALCCALAASAAQAQRPRTIDHSAPTSATTPPAPASVKAKYEGGVTGYLKKQTGTVNFDDAGARLVFKDKDAREYFSLPYKSFAAAWSDTHAVTSTAAKVVSAVPLYGIGLTSLLMPKHKERFLVIQFDDPDTRLSGTTSFKMENKELVASVLNTLAQKAELTARGEAYIRPPK
ncbi:MAG: hypothetical protein ACJ741_19955, partial [Pyrinomonadaceae bacterium]